MTESLVRDPAVKAQRDAEPSGHARVASVFGMEFVESVKCVQFRDGGDDSFRAHAADFFGLQLRRA